MVDVRVPDFRFCEGRTILRGSIEGLCGYSTDLWEGPSGGLCDFTKRVPSGKLWSRTEPKPRALYSASYEHEIRPHDSLIRVSRLIATGQFPRRVYLVGIHLTVINVQIEPPVEVRS